jgi:pimeloyl-ACP methyl ester carboxylesterase
MPEVQTADGVTLHWEERGVPEGPLLVGSMHFNAPPSVFEGLWADLARDHRVVTYDLRGVGESTADGPYDLETDAADLVTVVEAAGNGAATVVAFGDGTNRAVRAAAAHPDLIRSVVGPAGNPLGRRAAEGGSGLASSTGVLQLLQEQMRRDYRAALREMISSANPDWDDDVIRERIEMTVEYCPQDAAAERLTNWIEDDALEFSRALGDRLWIIAHGQNPWFPRDLAERTRELAPEARVVELEDGPVTRPDLHAAVVREAVAQKARSVG